MEEIGDVDTGEDLGTDGSHGEDVLEDITSEATGVDIGLEELGPRDVQNTVGADPDDQDPLY